MCVVWIYSDFDHTTFGWEHKQMLNKKKTRHIFALFRNIPNIFFRESASSIFRYFFFRKSLIF